MPRVAATVVTPWESDPVVERLTNEIAQLHTSTARKLVDALVQLGRLMQRVKTRLDHGEWARWVDTAVPLNVRTIGNYMALAEWATAHPADLDRFRELGPSKLYRLAAAPRPVVAKLKARKRHSIPGHDAPKTLAVMSTIELGRLIADLTPGRATPPVKPISIRAVVGDSQRRIASLQESAAALIKRRREVDPEDAAAMHADLLALTNSLARAFRL